MWVQTGVGGADHEVIEEFVDDFVVFWTVEVDVSTRGYAEVAVYTVPVAKVNKVVVQGLDNLDKSPAIRGGEIVRPIGLETTEALLTRDRVDP